MTACATNKPYHCDLCPYAAKRKDHLRIHLRTHTGERPFKCTLCVYAASTKQHLEKHMQSSAHSGDGVSDNEPQSKRKSYTCKLCTYETMRSDHFKVHTRTHTNEKPYKCTLCPYAGKTSGHLSHHIRNHTGEKPHKCTLCSFACKSRGNLRQHLQIHAGKKPYKCRLCPYAATRAHHLRAHMRSRCHQDHKTNEDETLTSSKCKRKKIAQEEKQNHTCSFCSYETRHKNRFRTHMRSHADLDTGKDHHTKGKPYRCKLCSYSASQSSNLTVHMRVHTGETPYKCTVCTFAASHATALSRHVALHSRATGTVFKCDVCNHEEKTPLALKVHVRTHKPYKCARCPFAACSRSNVAEHMRTHTNERPYPCPMCDHKAKTASQLKAHMSSRVHRRDRYPVRPADQSRLPPYQHNRNNLFKCRFCDYTDISEFRLQLHTRSHRRRKPFKCTTCSYSSYFQKHVTEHMRSHTRARVDRRGLGWAPTAKPHDAVSRDSSCVETEQDLQTLTVPREIPSFDYPDTSPNVSPNSHQSPCAESKESVLTLIKSRESLDADYRQTEKCAPSTFLPIDGEWSSPRQGAIKRASPSTLPVHSHTTLKNESLTPQCFVKNDLAEFVWSTDELLREIDKRCNVYQCKCGSMFLSFCLYNMHKAWHGDDVLTCAGCGLVASNAMAFMAHCLDHAK